MLLALGLSVFVPYDALAAILPTCEAVAQRGERCFFCGMTRSFVDMSHRRLSAAFKANPGGPFLYALFWMNVAATAYVLACRPLRKRSCEPHSFDQPHRRHA